MPLRTPNQILTEYQGPPPPTEETVSDTTASVYANSQDGSWVDSVVRFFTRTPPTYSFGTPTKGSFSEVSAQDEAKVGDIVRITYDLKLPFLQDWQKDYFVSKVQNDPRFEVRYVAYSQDEGKVWIEVKILQAMSPVVLVAVAIIGVVAVIGIWITTSKLEKLSTVTVGGVKINTFPLIAGGVIVVLVLWQWTKLKHESG